MDIMEKVTHKHDHVYEHYISLTVKIKNHMNSETHMFCKHVLIPAVRINHIVLSCSKH